MLLAFIAAVVAGPVSISDNNVGDIVTFGINANAQLSNHVEQNIISVIIALLNQQALLVGGNEGQVPSAEVPSSPKFKITPEMVETFKSFLAEK